MREAHLEAQRAAADAERQVQQVRVGVRERRVREEEREDGAGEQHEAARGLPGEEFLEGGHEALEFLFHSISDLVLFATHASGSAFSWKISWPFSAADGAEQQRAGRAGASRDGHFRNH